MTDFLFPRRIEFVVTNLCNGQCIHCYAEKQKKGYTDHIDQVAAVDVVTKVGRKFTVKSVMTFGGEPMLFPDVVCSIHRAGAQVGIPKREVITNGYWSTNARDIPELSRRLVESGVNEVLVSVDAFHQQSIPLEPVKQTIKSCMDAGIEDVALNPCWVISKEDNNPYDKRTRAIIAELEDLRARVSQGNTLEPAGIALTSLKEFLPPRNPKPKGRCGDIPYTEPLDDVSSISIEPDGELALCKDFHIGNIHKTDVLNIIERYNPHQVPWINALIKEGLPGLLKWAESRGVSPDPLGYYNICHMCTDLRTRAQKQQKPHEGETQDCNSTSGIGVHVMP